MPKEEKIFPQDQIDQLYHLLREVHFADRETKEAIHGLSSHLLLKSDYVPLVQYLDFYGNTYLLPKVLDFLDSCDFIGAKNIFDLGCGTGWLGIGIVKRYGSHSAVLLDKRSFVMFKYNDQKVNIENDKVDLETQQGIDQVSHMITDNDLVVMCDTLHCLKDPVSLLIGIKGKAPILVLEYVASKNAAWHNSYVQQLYDYGAKPFDANQILSMVEGVYEEVAHGPHTNTKPPTNVKYQLVEPYIMIYAR